MAKLAPMNPHRKARLVYRATTLFARLPWPLLRAFAHALAWTWVRLNARESRVTRRNLELAYPELDGPARDRLQGVDTIVNQKQPV